MNAKRGAVNAAASLSLTRRYKTVKDGELRYVKHRTYKSKLAQEASRIAIQTAMNEINQLYPNYLKNLQKSKRAKVFNSQIQNQKTLIKNQTAMVDDNFGWILDSDSKRQIQAVDSWGNIVQEALMLYYKGDEYIDAQQYFQMAIDARTRSTRALNTVADFTPPPTKYADANFKTKIVCHIDLAPQISLSSNKNVILTSVQGRDFTRKELVSGGDLQFSVSGNIQCDQSGVYPTLAVKKFVQAMQYDGLLTIHHYLFKYLGVTKVLIKDWNLGAPEYKNMQPYTFTCVAIEPDEEIQMTDTIEMLNNELEYDEPLKSWQKILVSDQFARITQNAIGGLMNATISELTDLTSGRI